MTNTLAYYGKKIIMTTKKCDSTIILDKGGSD
jgi:hypothetical protein